MRQLKHWSILMLVLMAITACGGGSGGGSVPAATDISGKWSVSESLVSNCPTGNYAKNPYSVFISQNANNITVDTTDGLFSGTVNGNNVSWSGSYFDADSGGTVTITSMSLTTSGNDSMSGSATWDWSDGSLNCSGNTTINLTRISGGGPTPAAPTNLIAQASSVSIKLTWTDNSNETSFVLERSSTSPQSGFNLLPGVISPNTTFYKDTGLTASTTYYYRIRARNANGDSAHSNVASATTGGVSIQAPLPPSSLSANVVSSSRIQLSWFDASTNETGFKIERSTTSPSTSFSQIATSAAEIEAYTDTGLFASTTYYYRVRATNAAGDSTYSNAATVTTPAGTAPPAAPTNLSANATASTSVQLNWSDTSGNETGFKIERSTASPSTGFNQIALPAANTTTYTNTGLFANTTYYYRIRATNAAGNSPYSNVATVTTPAGTALPLAPSNPIVTNISTTSATLNWTDNSNNEVGYKVGTCSGRIIVGPRPDNAISCSSITVTAILLAGTTSYPISGLSAGTAYSYFVFAYNNAGASANIGRSITTSSGAQTVTLTPRYENFIQTSSSNIAIGGTVYRDIGFGVGCNWIYNTLLSQQIFVCGGGLLSFDTSSLAGKTIDSATLILKTEAVGTGFYPRNWHTRAMASPWSTNTVTWNVIETSTFYTGSETALTPPTLLNQIYNIDVKTIVSNWSNGLWNNYGLTFGSQNFIFPFATSFDSFFFYSRLDPLGDGPKLVVTYH